MDRVAVTEAPRIRSGGAASATQDAYNAANQMVSSVDGDGVTYYFSGKRSQERTRSCLPWRLTSSGRGCRAVCAAA